MGNLYKFFNVMNTVSFIVFKVRKNHKHDISGGDDARGKVDQVDDKKLRSAHSGEFIHDISHKFPRYEDL